MKENATALSYLFTPTVLKEMYENKSSNKLINVFRESNIQNLLYENTTLKELFENAYKQLLKTYRNEYVFKNAIAKKILLGRHSINSSTLFTEFRVETSKADVVIFNGTTHVYEIKTELDTIERLENQIANYKKVFEFVNVVTVESKVKTIEKIIDEDVGILVLTEQYTLNTIRKAKSNLAKLDKASLFNLLRKNEYLKIIKKQFGYIPDVPNTKIYTACLQLFVTLSINEIHKIVLQTLKNRVSYKNLVSNIKQFPDSLKVAILEANLNLEEQKEFLKLLNTKVNNIFSQRGKYVSSIS
ncbi:putative CII phage-related protein [Sulfurovum sp. enrichment culture clone C5]|uniref:Putative CII phage-related protein n=1 Tax=Sulfurovum sp. enrichment culture clone C5 TaxID=497650 RepID=A0A0S4XMX4_9BACT|nr:putative CII phage-related protein [Sulfurovum sp. enrichment culture clone C5]